MRQLCGRWSAFRLVLLAFALSRASTLRAQVPVAGQNVNMVSGTQWPGGDPFLQRQNEPSLAVSSRNSLHLLAGANDYRTVDLPLQDTVPGEGLAGDAWLGVFKSFDGGQSWKSTLLPGYPQDRTPAGLASPIKGFTTAADPVIRAGTNGLFYYSGIAFNRGTNQGKVFVSVWIDLANKENGEPTSTTTSMNTDSIRYVRTVAVDDGNGGQFLDKPWLAVDIPRAGAGVCTLQVPQPGGGAVAQSFAAGNVYMTYSTFLGSGNNIHTKLYFARSTDCGATWGNPSKLSEGDPVNQGSVIAIDPTTGYVYVAWRGFSAGKTPNTLNIVRSTDGGNKFTKGQTVLSLQDFDPAHPTAASFFDQGTTGTTFRTNSFPALAADGSGRVYLAWSQRDPSTNGDARIWMKTSPDGSTWSPAFLVDNSPVVDDLLGAFNRGHQFMPSMTMGGGKVVVLYYDQRLDHTVGQFFANEPFSSAHGHFYNEQRNLSGELLTPGGPTGTAMVFNAVLSDAGLSLRRHTLDLRVAEASPSASPLFTSARVSQYKFGTRGGTGDLTVTQLQVNPPNLPMFQLGQVPFLGDYIDIAGPSFTKDASGNWKYNTASSTGAAYYASWTSNQDVVPPVDPLTHVVDWSKYTPPISAFNAGAGGNASIYDPNQAVPACTTAFTGSRNQNIYSSRITQGLLVGSPQSSKPLSTMLQRGFAVNVSNDTATDRSFRLTIPVASQPPGGYASFTPGINHPGPPAAPPTPPAPVLTLLDVAIAAHSGVSRSVYAVSSSPTAPISVNVDEIDHVGGSVVAGGLSSFVLLNADGTVPPLADPDGAPAGAPIQTVEIYTPNVTNPNVTNPNVTNPNVTNVNTQNPNVTNPNVTNPNVTNPNVTNPNVTNPNVTNADIATPNVTNPNVTNPNVTNPNVTNPNVTNPNVTNPNVTNYPVADSTYAMTNTGNTSATYQVKLARVGTLPTTPLQLMVNKVTSSLNSDNCYLFPQFQNSLQVNVTNPVFTDIADIGNATVNDPGVSNATFSLAPGETALVTLRGSFPAGTTDIQAQQAIQQIAQNAVVPVAIPAAPNTNDPTNTPAPAPPGGLFITTTSLPSASVGQPYSQTLQRLGGVNPVTWSVIAGALPSGFALNPATGVITNTTPGVNVAGTFAFTVQVMDSSVPALGATRALSLFVNALAVLTTGSPLNAVAGSPFAVLFHVQDSTGAPVPGAAISLGFGTKPCPSATLSGTLLTISNAIGNASFPAVVVDRGGPGMTLTATAVSPGFGPALATTPPIFVEGSCNTGSVLTPRAYATLTRLADGRVLLAGGKDAGLSVLATAEVYDPSTGVFTPTAGSLIIPRAGHRAVLLPSGKVLLAGGESLGGILTATAELFDPVLGTFSVTGSMGIGRDNFRATWVPTVGKVLVTGGNTLGGIISGSELFDPGTGTFSPTGSMTTPRELHSASLLADGRVLVAGGVFASTLASAEVWEPTTGAFAPTGGPLGAARDGHEAITLSDGRVLVVGGESSLGGSPLASTELYDPATDRFGGALPMGAVRSLPLVAPLPSGKVFVAGGFNPGELTTAEEFDPATIAFTPTASMAVTHGAGGAVLLSSGQVLVAGSDQFFSAAELFSASPAPCSASALAAQMAAAAGSTATINLPAGCLYTLTAGSLGDPATGLPHVTAGTNLTINGNGSIIQRLANEGGPAYRLFAVDPGATLTLNGVNVRNGGCTLATTCGFEGGGASNSGTLNVVLSRFSGNGVFGDLVNSRGGAVSNFGALTVDRSMVTGNTADNNGGAIFNWGGTLAVTGSTFVNNLARNAGGVLVNFTPLSATVTNSTMIGNNALGVLWGTGATGSAFYSQGWIFGGAFGSLTVTNATIYANAIFSGGADGAISTEATPTTILQSSIVSGSAPGTNCSGFAAANDGGYNISDDGSCGFAAVGSLNSTNPLFSPAGLSALGGPTLTVALLPGSPAVDAIPAGVNGCGTTLTTDQRGFARPDGGKCDIGAVEFPPVFFGLATISNVKLNGGSNVLTLPGGGSFTLDHDYVIANPVSCPGCIDQIEVGPASGLYQACTYDSIPPVSGVAGHGTTILTVPAASGLYYIGMDYAQTFFCHQFPFWWSGPPGPNRYIAVVVVP